MGRPPKRRREQDCVPSTTADTPNTTTSQREALPPHDPALDDLVPSAADLPDPHDPNGFNSANFILDTDFINGNETFPDFGLNDDL